MAAHQRSMPISNAGRKFCMRRIKCEVVGQHPENRPENDRYRTDISTEMLMDICLCNNKIICVQRVQAPREFRKQMNDKNTHSHTDTQRPGKRKRHTQKQELCTLAQMWEIQFRLHLSKKYMYTRKKNGFIHGLFFVKIYVQKNYRPNRSVYSIVKKDWMWCSTYKPVNHRTIKHSGTTVATKKSLMAR